MTLEEDIEKDRDACFGSLALEDQIRKMAWKLYTINPKFVIGSLLLLVDSMTKEYGVDCTKKLEAIAKYVDKQKVGE